MPTVLGIDFGSDNCVIAAASFNATKGNNGSVESFTVEIDGLSVAAPSVVQFGTRCRNFGLAAKVLRSSNATNTVFGFKGLLGRNFEDAKGSQFAENSAFKIIPSSDGSSAVRVSHLARDQTFSIEHISGMLLRKLSQTALRKLDEDVADCVVSVPSYFTDVERRALLTACELIGLNVMQIFDETSAAALSYGYNLPSLAKIKSIENQEENHNNNADNNDKEPVPRNVFFVDCGHTALQVFACSFYNDKFKILAAVADPNLGGQDINQVLIQHFASAHQKETGVDILKDKKIYWDVMEEVDAIKKDLSTHATAKRVWNLPMTNETGGGELKMRISREELEQLCIPLFSRIQSSLRKCLAGSGLELSEIHSVEILGGTTRMPGVQDVISKVFGKNCSTTLNSDEAVASGCALKGAMNLPNFNGRKYSASSVLLFPISLSWETESSEITLVEIFHKNQEIPGCELVSMNYAPPPLTFHAVYSTPGPTQNIGVYTVRKNHSSPQHLQSPSEESEKLSEIRVTIKINSNGILEVVKATYSGNDDLVEGQLRSQAIPNVEESLLNGSPPKPQQLVDLHIHSKEAGNPRKNLERLVAIEENLLAHDQQEEERLAAKTALKNYLHSLRRSISGSVKTSEEVNELLKKINLTETWMDDDKNFAIGKYSFIERHQELQEMSAITVLTDKRH